LWAAAALLVTGCGPSESITSYDTPRTEERLPAVDPDEVREQLDHMFTAIVPAGEKAWFFKLVVTGAAADAVRQPFADFVATVDVDAEGDLPGWTLPDGWEQQEGEGMRAATITIPHDDSTLELAVSTLPLGEDWERFLQQNVERWMDQLDQEPLSLEKIEELVKTLPTKSGDATLLELVGVMQRDAMAGGGMPAGHPPVESAAPAERTEEEPAEAAAPSSSGFAYETPPGWQPGTMVVMGMRREAAFVIPAEGGQAELAVTKFPATGAMAQLEPNVQRWAGQVGVTDLSADDIRDAAERIEIAGEPALQFEFFSPAGAPDPQAIFAVMAVRGDVVWFVKLWGDRPAVESQREAFDSFLASIRFDADE
jgi:hypothetical protein